MGLASRVKKLQDAVPKCDGRITRIAKPGEVLTEADRCRICGECHVLVIQRVVVKRGLMASSSGLRRGEP
jgi:hypothetical protein